MTRTVRNRSSRSTWVTELCICMCMYVYSLERWQKDCYIRVAGWNINLEMRSSFLGKSVAVNTSFTAHRGKQEPKKCSPYLLRLVFHLPGRGKNSSPGSFVLPGSAQSESHWRRKHLAVPSGQRCRKSSRSSQRDRSYCNHTDHGFWFRVKKR